ncbi:hypothetical protein J2X20_004878 [Pelomonas saccharophila]|uniref:DUF4124 domain-containing protein n=1 Tax=Roseateles saccharophilus TaxID=304 RepID=A0ABU1YTL1_ROSSA|nr:hypothetical protein [Roseateles saccharophilus]MDR7272204.1 hypothetical protein [Roseateles saccharophilus]
MKRVALGLAVCVMLGAAWAQQVWRCEQDGQVRYTDQPCEKSGRPVLLAAAPASGASQAADPPASAPSAAADEAAVRPPVKVQPVSAAGSRRAHRGTRAPQFAMQGLMDTDFVQRGHAPKRQNPASTPTP